MLLESRPTTLIAAKYTELPFPILAPIQEVAFDLGITAQERRLEISGVVFQGYNDHQLLFEQRWPARVIRQRLGEENLVAEAGTGLALRSVHFQIPAFEPLTHLEVTVLVRHEAGGQLDQQTLHIPVRYHTQQTDLHFPLRGSWWAIQGNDWSDRHKQEVFTQTYAIDFVKLGSDNAFFRASGTQLDDHYSWDQPVYASAGGKVAYVTYDLPDLVPGATPDPRMFRDDPRRLLGNAVAVSHGSGEFSFFGCLQQASLQVREGQVIKRGTLLGRVGNSGLTPGPHLHFHLAEGPNPFIDQGLPACFSHFSSGGQYFAKPVTIPTRQIVFGPETAPEEGTQDG
ncbi:MAG: M23 family metallopeptidase [Caldilineaceae bacterium]|nr:M23 family metallopeptidase [Caldilineaceae bacterium]